MRPPPVEDTVPQLGPAKSLSCARRMAGWAACPGGIGQALSSPFRRGRPRETISSSAGLAAAVTLLTSGRAWRADGGDGILVMRINDQDQ
jgi:hypothetical protein